MASYAATSQESESRYLELLERVSESVRTARLNPQERSVINHRYGFDGQEVTRGVRIGERMGVTESRVSQIHASALAKIRKTVSDSA